MPVSLFVSLTFLATPTPAPAPAPPGFAASVEVAVVDLSVIARDSKGRSVTGLKAENFRVLADGVPQEITNFAEVSTPPVAADRATAETPGTPAAVPSPSAQPAPAVDNRIAILFDNLHLNPGSRDRAIQEIRDELAPLLSGGRTAILIASYYRDLNVVLPYSTLRADFERGLERIRGRGAGAGEIVESRERVREALNSASAAVSAQQRLQDSEGAEYQAMLAMVESYASSDEHDLRRSLSALRSTIESIAGLPGRKAILYVSDAISITPGEDAYTFLDQVFPNAGARLESMKLDRTRDFKEITARANAAGVTLYVLGTGRPQFRGVVTAERQRPWDPRYRGLTLDDMGQAAMQRAAEMLASDTGGLALVGVGDLGKALARVRSDFESWYSLGIRAPAALDVLHDLEVEVVGAPEVKELRYRRGYSFPSEERRIEEAVLSRLDFDAEENPLEVRAELATVGRKPDGDVALELRLHLPWKNLLLAPAGAEHRGELVVRLAFQDGDGASSEVRTLKQPLVLPEKYLARARSASYRYVVDLALPPGPWTVSVAVTDVLSRTTSYLRFERLLR